MDSIGILFCFLENSFSGEEIAKLSESNDFLGFKPKKIRCYDLNLNGTKFIPSRHLKSIKSLKMSIDLSIESQDFTDSKFSISTIRHNIPMQVLRWDLLSSDFHNLKLSTLMEKHGFIIGYVFDQDYGLWESEERISNYEYWEKPYDHLSQIWDEDFNEYKIDISNNPGRMGLVSGMWLMSCWRMYFGKEFFKHVPKEKLLSFNEANKVEELLINIVFIELYENIFESDLDKNRELQRKFRDYIGMDEIDKKLS